MRAVHMRAQAAEMHPLSRTTVAPVNISSSLRRGDSAGRQAGRVGRHIKGKHSSPPWQLGQRESGRAFVVRIQAVWRSYVSSE